jgi:hypothetical protein
MNILSFVTEADWTAITDRLEAAVDRSLARHGFAHVKWASAEPRNGPAVRAADTARALALLTLIQESKNAATMVDAHVGAKHVTPLLQAILAVEREFKL